MKETPNLNLSNAKLMADAAEAKALENNITIVISLYDNHGNLKYFRRMDNTSYGSIRVSQLKAKTSASFPISSNDLAKRSANLATNPYSTIPDILTLGGGLPIFIDNTHVGSIGISGATPELDELCAKAAIDLLQAKLSA